MGLGETAKASESYQEALGLLKELDQEGVRIVIDAQAGLASAALAQGDLNGAIEYVEIAMSRIPAGELDPNEASEAGYHPIQVYMNCYRVLNAAHKKGAFWLLERAVSCLRVRIAQISDPEHRRATLEDIPLHAEIIAAYQDLEAHPNRGLVGEITHLKVQLPRLDVPLGRALTPEDYTTVVWMLVAPEDALAVGKVALRRGRILRLLSQAEAQGAAPRDADLADALGVGLATIRRDMAALREEGHSITTRWRRAANGEGQSQS
jgi:hypothetical protein